jgi:phospholipid transport system substrate-binding protein
MANKNSGARTMRVVTRGVFILCGLMLTFSVQAAQAAINKSPTPHQLIANTTDELIAVINDAKGYFDNDPERFYKEVERIIDPLINFKSFARSVMGKYVSKRRYDALKSDAERKQFVQRINRFSKTFKEGLVKTYGKGLLTFDGQKIEVLPPNERDMEDIKQGRSVDVTQLIHGTADQPYVVVFKMRKDRDDQWKLRNVTIEAINIGKVYRSQFEAAMEKYNDDMDKVIDTWTVTPQEFEQHDAS